MNRLSHTTPPSARETMTPKAYAENHARLLNLQGDALVLQRWAVEAQKLLRELTRKVTLARNAGLEEAKPLQGLASYLRAQGRDLLEGTPSRKTLLLWAAEVDAASEPQPDCTAEILPAPSANYLKAWLVEPVGSGFDAWWPDFAPHMTRTEAVDAWNAAQPAKGEYKPLGSVHTVADLVNNLSLMDQTLPIYGAQYIEQEGKRRYIAVPPTVSRERVQDSRWIGEGEELNAAIVWTRASQPEELTPEMISAGDAAWMTGDGIDSAKVYWAMQAARPQP